MADKWQIRNSIKPNSNKINRMTNRATSQSGPIINQAKLNGPNASSILALQQLVGNKAIQRHLDTNVQAKNDPAPTAPDTPVQDLDLNDRPTLYPGSTGPYVELLQNKLRAAYFFKDGKEISGNFDGETQHFVIEFQKSMKLTPDGIVGARTWDALDASSRGRAMSDTNEERILTKTEEARDLFAEGHYKVALPILNSLYADPLMASKPLFLARIIWGIASCHQRLAFAADVPEEQKKQKLNEAMSWFQEYGMREGLDTTHKMNVAIKIRECRLGLPPTSYNELEEWKEEMN